jgi:hypothetical protein
VEEADFQSKPVSEEYFLVKEMNAHNLPLA